MNTHRMCNHNVTNMQLVYILILKLYVIGSFCGSLSCLKASLLGSIVIKESLAKVGLNGTDVSEVIMGQVYLIFQFFKLFSIYKKWARYQVIHIFKYN